MIDIKCGYNKQNSTACTVYSMERHIYNSRDSIASLEKIHNSKSRDSSNRANAPNMWTPCGRVTRFNNKRYAPVSPVNPHIGHSGLLLLVYTNIKYLFN